MKEDLDEKNAYWMRQIAKRASSRFLEVIKLKASDFADDEIRPPEENELDRLQITTYSYGVIMQ